MAAPPAAYAGQSNPTQRNTTQYDTPVPKSVAFELWESPQYRARLPMRVQIFLHDTTESIITTVRNFYGLYAGHGGAKSLSFEDEQGHTLIAHYENLRNNMIVYVRVIEPQPTAAGPYDRNPYISGSPVHPQAYYAGDGHRMPPPQPAQALSYGQPLSRPTSRSSRKRSVSPGSRGRSASVDNQNQAKKSRSRSGFKSRGSSTHGSFADNHSDAMNGYSSGDGAPGSVSSKTRSEHIGNTEISLDNIVEGGRRKRAKFESSELPLFAPPQMPAATSNSSVSPARRMEHQRPSFPFTNPSHNPFSNPQPMQSPQNYSGGFGQPGLYTTPALGRRTRGDASYPANRQSIGSTPTGNSSGILPTPDPTVGSCMSEEDKDVALQLMRLGEMSNISHGRTSASTFADDTFSGKADAASSCATSDNESESEDELPPARRQKREESPVIANDLKKFHPHLNDLLPSNDSTEPSADEGGCEDGRDGTFRPGLQDEASKLKARTVPPMGKPRTSASGAKIKSSKPKQARSGQAKSKKPLSALSNIKPISPTSLPSQSRKTSNASAINFQHQLGTDEEDLSSKPRCQRCRKSKKGCDRQRPCQRCKDAGLSADQCVSEDEGNGRKGRYGRHMGVSVKKDEMEALTTPILPPGYMAGAQGSPDKSKKRKR
ncbi:hypothetical protein BJ878DRAFT_425056 [Calycina marina]|uniref:Zn(2)-C6 fungal-type domain-containing protein n=1 Tax=Calycina marina TaxID=1763456 RepID=A0A9P8CDK1_9HELO|nr:hypothetical protein BJ878DRAFT_425056 [Calycina marina]